MFDLKRKALGGIKDMLDERMAGRMKPKAIAVEAVAGKAPMMEGPGGDEEQSEPSKEAGMEAQLEGGELDLSKLTPEEQSQLMHLYEKAST